MKKLGRLIGLVSCAGLMTLSGCVLFVRGVHDLKFSEVQSVKAGTLNLQSDYPLKPHAPASQPIGGIEVTSNTDLHSIAMESQLNLWFSLTLCKTGAVLAKWDPEIYYKGVQVNYNGVGADIQELYARRVAGRAPGEPFRYEVYFEPQSDVSQIKGPGWPDLQQPYDLAKNPVDLCLQIGGGNMAYGHFVSNTVVVPAEAVASAFRGTAK